MAHSNFFNFHCIIREEGIAVRGMLLFTILSLLYTLHKVSQNADSGSDHQRHSYEFDPFHKI